MRFGEENLTIVVRSTLRELAAQQFPAANVISLPVKDHAKSWQNLLRCRREWRHLRAARSHASVSLRSMRSYFQLVLYYSIPAERRLLTTNLMNTKAKRRIVEGVSAFALRAEVLPYPDAQENWPSELEAHRILWERLIGSPASRTDVLPRLNCGSGIGMRDWVLCPLSSLEGKNLPTAHWRSSLGLVAKPSSKLHVVGAASQRNELEAFAAELKPLAFAEVSVQLPPTLPEFVSLLAQAEVVLTVDTAAAHISTALDRPTVVAFSGLHRGMFGPWTRGSRQVWLEPASGDGKWHHRLDPAKVAGAIRSLSGQS